MLSLKLAKVVKEAGGAVRLGRLVTSIETDAHGRVVAVKGIGRGPPARRTAWRRGRSWRAARRPL